MKSRLLSIGLVELALLLAVTGCVGMHADAPILPPTPAAPQETVPAAPMTESPKETPPAEPIVASNVQACSCVENKAKPKPKPKSKVVRKEAPPQLPTAPVVENTPPGGLIDAQVRSMSVSVMSILGKRVRGANGEDLGRVVDVLADASGRVRTAIIDFGGFLGVGNHRIAVDWPLLRFNPDGTDPSLLLSLSPDKVRLAPEYKENARPQILMVPTASTTAPAD